MFTYLCCLLLAAALEPPPIEPDPELLAELRQMFTGEGLETREEGEKHLEKLKRLGREQPAKVVQQLLYLELTADDERIWASHGMASLGLGWGEIREGLLPLIHTDHERLRHEVREILSGFEHRRADCGPDYSLYRSWIEGARNKREKLPMPLIEYMYEQHPGNGLLTVLYIFQDGTPQWKGILWAEHFVSDVLWKERHDFDRPAEEARPEAIRQLRTLSNHPDWWVRLYVAEIMRQHPQFRTDEIVARLQEDKHESIQRVMSQIKPDTAAPMP